METFACDPLLPLGGGALWHKSMTSTNWSYGCGVSVSLHGSMSVKDWERGWGLILWQFGFNLGDGFHLIVICSWQQGVLLPHSPSLLNSLHSWGKQNEENVRTWSCEVRAWEEAFFLSWIWGSYKETCCLWDISIWTRVWEEQLMVHVLVMLLMTRCLHWLGLVAMCPFGAWWFRVHFHALAKSAITTTWHEFGNLSSLKCVPSFSGKISQHHAWMKGLVDYPLFSKVGLNHLSKKNLNFINFLVWTWDFCIIH